MALPNFIVTGNLKEILAEASGGELTETALSRGYIIFRSNVPKEFFLLWDDTLYPAPGDVIARINTSGNIVDEDDQPILLLANDSGLNINNLQWQVIVVLPSSVIPPLPARTMRSWWIDAGADGETVNIKDSVPAVLLGSDTDGEVDGGTP